MDRSGQKWIEVDRSGWKLCQKLMEVRSEVYISGSEVNGSEIWS